MADTSDFYTGYNPNSILNSDSETGVRMMDKITRIGDKRRIAPLDQFDNIQYGHRLFCDKYNLMLGDCLFIIPPEFIMVTSENTSQNYIALRQENTQKTKSGHHKRTILIDLVFYGLNQINGYPVESPEGTYYVDGLRELLAQFKCTPFLPITNDLINTVYGIFTVALQSITITAMEGFPDVLQAQITLQEVNLFPYLEVPNVLYQFMIDWDLFRYYYQRQLTENHEYKKLQSIPKQKDSTKFKISTIDPAVFDSEDYNDYNLLEIITDKKIGRKNEDGTIADSNYITWVDSETSNVVISNFQCGYSNMLTNLSMASFGEPTIQYLGGMDTIYTITFETTDIDVVRAIEQCQITNDLLIRENARIINLGFVKLESELVEFTGSLFVSIDSVTSNTVPGFPGLFMVQVNCVAFDISQSKREDLKGFTPFDCDDSFSHPSNTIHDEQVIDQSYDGLMKKARQDTYAENKIRKEIELYPDLNLPTYAEVDEVINKIRTFRENNVNLYGEPLSQLEYTEYPKDPVTMYHGVGLDSDMPSIHYQDSKVGLNGTIVDTSNVDGLFPNYDIFVNPDFYVFYPHTYENFGTDVIEGNPYQDICIQKKRSAFSYSIKYDVATDEETDESTLMETTNSDGEEKESVSGNQLIENIITMGKKYLGCPYHIGDYGHTKINGKLSFDCSGFISFLLYHNGVMDDRRFSTSSMKDESIFEEIPVSEAKRGDLLQFTKNDYSGLTYGHVAIDLGNEKILHAGGATDGTHCVNIRNKDYCKNYPWKRAYRIKKAYINQPTQTVATKTESTTNTTTETTTKPIVRNLTSAEITAIARVVAAESRGESYLGQQAVAQCIYDRLVSGKYGDLSSVLYSKGQFASPWQGNLTATTCQKAVITVFCQGERAWPNQTYYFLSPSASSSVYDDRNKAHTRYGDIGCHTFWGNNKPSKTIRFTVDGKEVTTTPTNEGVIPQRINLDDLQNSNTEASDQAINIENNASINKEFQVTLDVNNFTIDIRKFAMPILIKTKAIMEQNLRAGRNGQMKAEFNNDENIFCSSFCNMREYGAFGTLLKAFPTYMLVLLDDQSQWYDGRKLWTNYYFHRSVIDINVHSTNDMPITTATITINNAFHNLDRAQGGLSHYNLAKDKDYSIISRMIYDYTGKLPFGTKITKKQIQLHQKIYKHTWLREGARIHLRIGYGSDPLGLPTVINGFVTDVTMGEQIGIVAVSDGTELINTPVSAKPKDTNNGWFGLFGLGEEQEASDIISNMLTDRENNVINFFWNHWFEGSKYGIEHFGLYFTEFSLGNMFTGNTDQYDILKNIYKANYKRDHYIYYTLGGIDGEKNIVFSNYNKTVWDVSQICTQCVPEYILKPSFHQFDSRLYYGLPTWMEKYRYNCYYYNGKCNLFEEAKASTQFHFIDSMNSIIDNQVKCSSRNSFTNAKMLYQRGSDVASTGILYSDRTIDYSKQKTKIIDTSLVQDNLGWDWLYEEFGYKLGKESARRMGVSNILYSWQQQYSGDIILLGDAGIYPHDYIGLNDTFVNMFGLATVREVTHSFNSNTGFVTSVVPGMIGFNTDNNSQLYITMCSYLTVLQAFASYTSVRKEINNTFYKNLKSLCSTIQDINEKRWLFFFGKGQFYGGVQVGATIVTATKLVKTFIKVVKALRKGCDFAKAWKSLKTTFTALKVAKGVKNIGTTIYTGAISTGTAVAPGVGTAIAAVASWILVDILLDTVIEYHRNLNCVKLLPLWWESYPLCAGITGQTNLLIQPSNANATEEDKDKSTDDLFNLEDC